MIEGWRAARAGRVATHPPGELRHRGAHSEDRGGQDVVNGCQHAEAESEPGVVCLCHLSQGSSIPHTPRPPGM